MLWVGEQPWQNLKMNRHTSCIFRNLLFSSRSNYFFPKQFCFPSSVLPWSQLGDSLNFCKWNKLIFLLPWSQIGKMVTFPAHRISPVHCILFYTEEWREDPILLVHFCHWRRKYMTVLKGRFSQMRTGWVCKGKIILGQPDSLLWWNYWLVIT